VTRVLAGIIEQYVYYIVNSVTSLVFDSFNSKISLVQPSLICFTFSIFSVDEHWSTYWTFANVTIATILVIYVKEEYNRTKIE